MGLSNWLTEAVQLPGITAPASNSPNSQFYTDPGLSAMGFGNSAGIGAALNKLQNGSQDGTLSSNNSGNSSQGMGLSNWLTEAVQLPGITAPASNSPNSQFYTNPGLSAMGFGNSAGIGAALNNVQNGSQDSTLFNLLLNRNV